MSALTMQQLESLSASIKRRLLNPPAVGQFDQGSELSKQFAEAIFEIHRRLKQCLSVIGSGNAEQALTLAEENPPLLDAVALVNVSFWDQWEKLCQDNHWPVPIQLDTVAIRRLNDLYGNSGKSEESIVLKKQFRVAMLTKNHERALAISRRLENLEPGNADILSQGRELEKLVGRTLLSELRAALHDDEEDRVIETLDRIDAAGLSLEEPEIERASALRGARERLKDEEFALSLVGRLPDLQNEDRWQECSELLDEIQRLQTKHSLDFGKEGRDAVQASIAFVDASRREADRQRVRADALAMLDVEVGAAQTLLSKPGIAAAKLEDAEILLRRAFEAARAFDEAVPDELSGRASATLSDISDRVVRVHRLRRARTLALTGFALVALAALSVFSYCTVRATLLAAEIRGLIAERSATTLRAMVEDLQNRQSVLLLFPNLKNVTISAEEWLQSMKADEARAVELSEKLRAWDVLSFGGAAPREVFGTLKQFEEALAALPGDLSLKLGASSSETVARAKLWLADRQEETRRLVERKLGDLRPLAENLSEGQSTEKIKEAINQVRPHLEEILPRIEAAGIEAQIPEAMRAEINEIATKWRNLQRFLDELRQAQEKLNIASSLEQYWSAIDQLAKVDLPADSDVKAAQAMLIKKFTEQEALGSALLPQDPALWHTVKTEADLSKPLHPSSPTLEQAQILSRLINNPNMKDISELIVRKQDPYATPNEARPRLVYLRGEFKEQTTTGDGASPTYTSGDFYDPQRSPASAVFKPTTFRFVSRNNRGDVIDSKKKSEVSVSYEQLDIKGLTDKEYLQYNEGILPIMDRAVSSTSIPPLATAFVLKSLWEVASLDPVGWGISWAPALKTDMKNLQQAYPTNLDGSEWMVPTRQEDSSRVGAWLRGRPQISYAKQANLHRRLAMDALNAGMVYCGFVDSSGKNWHPQQNLPDSVRLLWGLEAGTGKVKPLMIREASAKNGLVGLSFKPAPLTPLLGSPLNQSDTIERAFTDVGIAPEHRSQYLAELPPLFRSNPLP